MKVARRRGQPLVVWGMVVVGWIGVRAAMILTEGDPELPPRRVLALPPRPRVVVPVPVIVLLPNEQRVPHRTPGGALLASERRSVARAIPAPMFRRPGTASILGNDAAQFPALANQPVATVTSPGEAQPVWTLPAGRTAASPPARMTGSAWVIVRGGSSAQLAPVGQLGGSQAGVRTNLRIAGPVIATARISAPLGSATGRQTSVGVGLRGRRVGILVERWVALDKGARNDFGVTAYAGVDSVRLPAGVELDGYAQAGIVGKDGFADGAMRLERRVLRAGPVTLAAGMGMWGGIQPGVARLDIGPQAVARIPIGDRALRLSAEWRQRVAGAAAPGSGPAVSLGLDF